MNEMLQQINSIGKAFVQFAGPMLIQSSVLILILLLADLLLRRRVRAVFRYWIWILVLVKLVLPTSLSLPMSFGYWFGNKLGFVQKAPLDSPSSIPDSGLPFERRATGIGHPVASVDHAGPIEPALMPSPEFTPTEPIPAEPVSSPEVSLTPLSWQGAVFLVWVAAVIVMCLLLLQRAIFVRRLIAQAEESTGSLIDALQYCCQQIAVKRKVSLKISPNASSPAVCGLFRPVILMPQKLASNLGSDRLQVVLMHELAHVKRADLWINTVQTALQIIYLYNPLLCVANAIIRRVREQAVDEIVLVAMGPKAQQYPETLLNVARLAFARPALSLRLIGVIESKNQLKERIRKMLERPVPKSAKLGIVGMLVVFALGAFLLPMAKANKSAADTPAVSEKPKTETEAELKMLQDQIVHAEKQLQRLEKQIQQKKSQIAVVETKAKEQSDLIKKDKQGAGKDKEKPKVTKEKAPAKKQSDPIKKEKQGPGKDKEKPSRSK
jgi:beta-lactamase regulating signal transducer with metallopeptidase domain